MGVYINGMDMPKSCYECRFAVDGWCYAHGKPNVEALSNEGITNWCPLIEVPKHGDLIDREAAIDALGEEPEIWSEDNEYELATNNQWRRDLNAIKSVPAVRTRRKTGRWIRKTDTRFGEMLNDLLICSECNVAFSTLNMIRRSYCPNCGAKMDETE